MEAIIPTKIGMPTLLTDMLEHSNTEFIIKELDTIDELRETAGVRVASHQRRLENLYNKRVMPRVFKSGNLVLRKVFENAADPVAGKF